MSLLLSTSSSPTASPLANVRLVEGAGGAGLQVKTSGITYTDAPFVIPKGEWLEVKARVDRAGMTYELEVDGETVSSSWTTGAPTHVRFGDIASTISPTGAGGMLLDDIVLRRFNEGPKPAITTPALDGPMPLAGLTIAGSVTDEVYDTVQRLEYQIGVSGWQPLDTQRFWSKAVSTPTVDSNWYWLNVRASDGDREGYKSVRFCNAQLTTTCANNPVVQTFGSQMTGIQEE